MVNEIGMATWEREIEYRCDNDCKSSGCPSHKMKVEIQTTADILTIYPSLGQEKHICFDMNRWAALKTVLQDWDYSGFDLSLKK